MLKPGEYCFGCMNVLPSENAVCKKCGWDNRERRNGADELPFALLAGKYLVGRSLGRGGFGITYVGLNTLLEKRVAVKEYFPLDLACRNEGEIEVHASSAEMEAKFEAGKRQSLEEARMIARVQNVSNVVNVYDCFSRNNTVYIIMEYLEGETFADFAAKKGIMQWKTLWPCVRPTGLALGRLHELDLVHRDISPDNIMIRKEDGQGVLLDFGAASNAVAGGEEHRTGMKDGYAALEQYQNREGINGLTDEYAWCATIWFMLTGSRPPDALQRKVQKAELRVPCRLRKAVPESVWKTLEKGMSLLQQDRYPSMEEVVRALDSCKAENRTGSRILMMIALAALAVMLFSLVVGIFGK